MIEASIALGIVLTIMSVVLFVLSVVNKQGTVYRSFFTILTFWFFLLALNTVKLSVQGSETSTETRFFDESHLNSSGGDTLFVVRNLNFSSNVTVYGNWTRETNELIDTATETWLWVAYFVTAVEFIQFMLIVLNMFGGGKGKPLGVKDL